MRKALELVAMRGRDVIGVRHLLEGGRGWLGHASDSFARVPMGDFGQAVLVGEVVGARFVVAVPPRARARLHNRDGLARLLVGPDRVSLAEGDRAVVVLGPVQVRARIVPISTLEKHRSLSVAALRWVAILAAIYVIVLAVVAVLAPARTGRLEPDGVEGSVRTISGPLLP